MQHINKNYFQLFNLSESFDLELDSLAEKYRQLQAESHPDRFANADEQDKLRAVQLSSYLNGAYATLKSPIKRAGYLLVLNDRDIERVEQGELGMDLLLEQMQLRESLGELPDDESALPALEKIKQEVMTKLAVRQQEFASQFDKGELDEAKKAYHELQFLNKLLVEIEVGEEQRLGY